MFRDILAFHLLPTRFDSVSASFASVGIATSLSVISGTLKGTCALAGDFFAARRSLGVLGASLTDRMEH